MANFNSIPKSVLRFSRLGAAVAFSILISGCSILGFGDSGSASHNAGYNECRFNPSQCMYNGPYEPGERQYAEEEARRLNRASLEKLRRSGIR